MKVYKYKSIQVHKNITSQVHQYTSTKKYNNASAQIYEYTEIVICKIPMCLNSWEITKFHYMTAVGATAVGVLAVRSDFEF